jgi:hypothetical protein
MSSLAPTRARSRYAMRCGLAALVLLGCTAAAHAERVESVCRELARRVERDEGIPTGLVLAVALAESGRWFRTSGEISPWPWTVTSGPDSFFLPSKQAALRKVRELQSEGRTNIDVGCMQVNLHYHGDEFASVEEAIDPVRNVAYGARFLKRLRMRTRSWAHATARYHSGDPARGEAYRTKVYRLWQKVRQGVAVRGEAGAASAASIVRGNGRQPGDDNRLATPGLLEAPPGTVPILRGR